MTRFSFAYPLVLLALLLLPLFWYLWLRRSARPAIRYSSLAALRAAGGARVRGRMILPVLRTIALACLIVAVARPRMADASSRLFAEGIAIQMVLDTSGSMRDFDLSPRGERVSRLAVVKEIFTKFVLGDDGLPGRPNDLIGMIRFAKYADSVCPLTLDHQSLIDIVNKTEVTPGEEGNATAIGDGLALGVERLKDLRRTVGSGEQLTIKSKVIILLSDGENNAGLVSPEQAGDMAATCGIRVYTILAGTGAQTVIGRRIPVDDSVMRGIAAKSGGQFYRAQSAAALARVYEQIDTLERTRVEERSHVRWSEESLPWLLGAFAALGLQMLLDATLLRKIP